MGSFEVSPLSYGIPVPLLDLDDEDDDRLSPADEISRVGPGSGLWVLHSPISALFHQDLCLAYQNTYVLQSTFTSAYQR